jgi:hypothetical protein
MILIFQCCEWLRYWLVYVSSCYGRGELNIFASCWAYLYILFNKSEFSNIMCVPKHPAIVARKERRKKVQCILNVSTTWRLVLFIHSCRWWVPYTHWVVCRASLNVIANVKSLLLQEPYRNLLHSQFVSICGKHNWVPLLWEVWCLLT